MLNCPPIPEFVDFFRFIFRIEEEKTGYHKKVITGPDFPNPGCFLR